MASSLMTTNFVIAQVHECVVVSTVGHEMNEIPRGSCGRKNGMRCKLLEEIGLAGNICRSWVGLFICVIVFDFSRAQLQNKNDYVVSTYSKEKTALN